MSNLFVTPNSQIVVDVPQPKVSEFNGGVSISYGSNPQQEALLQETVSRLTALEANVDEISGTGPGRSAYELAVENGFVGSLSEWLQSLKGTPGLIANYGPPPSPLPSGYSPGMVYLDLNTFTLYQLG